MKVKSNPSGKKIKVNELLKRLRLIYAYHGVDDEVADYPINETIKVMKEEGIMILPENWVLYLLHLHIFHNCYLAVSNNLMSTYKTLADNHEISSLISMNEGSYLTIKGIFNFARTGDLSIFLWMITSSNEIAEDDIANSDPVVSFAKDFKKSIEKDMEGEFRKIVKMLNHYYVFFKDFFDKALNVPVGMANPDIDAFFTTVSSSSTEKRATQKLAHFYAQGQLFNIKKISKHPLLPTGDKSARYYTELIHYFEKAEKEVIDALMKDRGNKFVPKVMLDWGETIIEYKEGRSTFIWERLNMAYSEREGKFGLHCGNSTRSYSKDRIFSLREVVGEKVKIHVTVTAELLKDGTFYQRESKGVGNYKPKEKYWEKIVDLWLSEVGNFSSIIGDGYWQENNLHFKDLSDDLKNRILKERPDLLTGFFYAIYKGNAMDGLKLVMMNHQDGNINDDEASAQILILFNHFLLPEDDFKKTPILEYAFLSRRRHEDMAHDNYEEDHATYLKNALKKIKVRGLNPPEVVKIINTDLIDTRFRPQDLIVLYSSKENAVKSLLGKVEPRTVESIVTYHNSAFYMPYESSTFLTRNEQAVSRNVGGEPISVISPGWLYRPEEMSEEYFQLLLDKHPEVFSDETLAEQPVMKFMKIMSKKYSLSAKKKTEDEEIARHDQVKGHLINWFNHRLYERDYSRIHNVEKEEAKELLKTFPFLKDNYSLRILADGSHKKVVDLLLQELPREGKQKPGAKVFQEVKKDKDGNDEYLVFKRLEGVDEAWEYLANRDTESEIDHLYHIVKEGYYEVSYIGMSDKELRDSISEFSGYVHKHDQELYKKISHWFEDTDSDSPEWDTDEGQIIHDALNRSYFSGYEAGAYDDIYNEVKDYLSDQLRSSTDFEIEEKNSTFEILVPIKRLVYLLHSFWIYNNNHEGLQSNIEDFLESLIENQLENPRYRGKDIDSFSWDAAYEVFLNDLQEYLK